MNTSRCTYTSKIIEIAVIGENELKTLLVLRDQGHITDSRSLTNGIEEVIKHDLKGMEFDAIIYADTEGTWDGYNINTNDFVMLFEEYEETAILSAQQTAALWETKKQQQLKFKSKQ